MTANATSPQQLIAAVRDATDVYQQRIAMSKVRKFVMKEEDMKGLIDSGAVIALSASLGEWEDESSKFMCARAIHLMIVKDNAVTLDFVDAGVFASLVAYLPYRNRLNTPEAVSILRIMTKNNSHLKQRLRDVPGVIDTLKKVVKDSCGGAAMLLKDLELLSSSGRLTKAASVSKSDEDS